MKVEIVAGPELNAAVARSAAQFNRCPGLVYSIRRMTSIVAIKAAKKVGLLDAEHFDLYHNRHQGWMVLQSIYEISEGDAALNRSRGNLAVLSYGESKGTQSPSRTSSKRSRQAAVS